MCSQVRRLIEHLLKLEYSPASAPRADWLYSVAEARDQVEDYMTASMKRDVETELAKLFERGRRQAAIGLRRDGEIEAANALPVECLCGFDQVVSQDWYPQNRHGLADE